MVPSSPWLALAYQLPAKPSNARVKVWRKLQSLGAVLIKNSFYVLPNRPETREDFDWLRKDILHLGGDGAVFLTEASSEAEHREIIKAFRQARDADFERVAKEIDQVARKLRSSRARSGGDESLDRQWAALKTEAERLFAIDFFDSVSRSKVAAALKRVQTAFERTKGQDARHAQTAPPIDRNSLKGRIWVTRPSPHSDRLASAWLIRRFIDPKARFRFAPAPYKPAGPRELRYDMDEAEFTHLGEWCTFETLMHRLKINDRAVGNIAEIVHDLDLKDGKFARIEVPGVSAALRGLCRLHRDDMKRLEAGVAFFDALHASLGSTNERD